MLNCFTSCFGKTNKSEDSMQKPGQGICLIYEVHEERKKIRKENPNHGRFLKKPDNVRNYIVEDEESEVIDEFEFVNVRNSIVEDEESEVIDEFEFVRVPTFNDLRLIIGNPEPSYQSPTESNENSDPSTVMHCKGACTECNDKADRNHCSTMALVISNNID